MPALGWLLPLLLWHFRRSGWAPGLVAALIGLGAGAAARLGDRVSCAARMAEGPVRLRLTLEQPVWPDGPTATAVPLGGRCSGAVTVRWPEGASVGAGGRVAVEGRWVPRRSFRAAGVLVVRQWRVEGFLPSGRQRLRNWLGQAIRRLYGGRSGTVEALVINRRGAMPLEQRERYARAGLVHLLSISGFHVGIIMTWLGLALARMLPPGRRYLWAVLGAVPYVMLIDWPAPAARALLLALIAAVERTRQRYIEPASLLGAACLLVLVIDPWAMLEPGAWLSALALLGAMTLVRWGDRAVGHGWFWRTSFASLGATLATAPITAGVFGTVSLAGVGLNFAAIPVAAMAVPGVFLSLLLLPVLPGAAERLAAGSGALLAGLDRLAWWGGGLTDLVVMQPAEPASALPWVLLLVGGAWALSGTNRGWVALQRGALLVALVSWIALAASATALLPRGGRGLSLHFLDVGQGDATVIRTPGGHWVVVDAGPRGDRDDAGRRVVAPYLARHGARQLSVMVISHAHADHIGGAPAVLERFPTAVAIEPAELVADPVYTGFLDEVAADGVRWQVARPGVSFELDGVRFRVLHPDTLWAEWRADLNEDSAVLLVEYRRFRAAFMGDAGLRAERRLAGRGGRVTLLKVGHHGSRSATGEAWLRELRPRIGLIGVGAGNRYGHPHREVLERLRRFGVSIWRTDLSGTVDVETDGTIVTVRGGGRREELAVDAGGDSTQTGDVP